MIDPKELRIGNYIKTGSCIRKVVTIYGGPDSDIVFEGEWMASHKDINPIPLTPEILEKIGMVKRFNDPDCNIFDMKDDPKTRNGGFSLGHLERGWVYPTAPGAVPFHYLHQLQNLYFALTQTELKVDI